MKWPDNAPFRTSGIEAQILFVSVNPVVAWEPIAGLSLALGPVFNYSEAKLRQGLAPPPFPFEFDFEGNDWSYGFNAGLLWQPHPQWSFGAKYYSASSMDYRGDGTINAPGGGTLETTTHLEYPQMFTVGVSFRPTTNWNLEINLDYTDWDTVDTADIRNAATSTSLPLYWESSWFYEFGVTRQLGKGYFLSAGYFFSQASTPEAYYTPLVPDTDLHVGSLGVGYRGRHWSWAVAGQVIGGSYRDIDNQVVDPSVDGRWKLFTPTVSASVGYHF
jgi:long-chain fatty acid transport protein